MSLGFDHATLVVTDLGESERFFAVLGFERWRATVVSGPTMAAYMGIPEWEADHVTLVLRDAPTHQEIQLLSFGHPAAEIDHGSGWLGRTGFNHLCFRVEDLDAVLAAFRSIGIEQRNEVLDFQDRRLVFVEGPAGVVVELAEWRATPGRADDLNGPLP